MYKVFLFFISVLLLTSNCTATFATTPEVTTNNLSIMYKHPSKEQIRKQFEERLNLTEKQKEKARLIHQKGKEEIQPVIIKLQAKHQELEMVRLSKLTDKEQKDRIDLLNTEISELEKQARDIRKKNTQEFEKILNKQQKTELSNMKAEGRARFEQNHQARPPFQGLGTPNFLTKPLLPPQNSNLFFNK